MYTRNVIIWFIIFLCLLVIQSPVLTHPHLSCYLHVSSPFRNQKILKDIPSHLFPYKLVKFSLSKAPRCMHPFSQRTLKTYKKTKNALTAKCDQDEKFVLPPKFTNRSHDLPRSVRVHTAAVVTSANLVVAYISVRSSKVIFSKFVLLHFHHQKLSKKTPILTLPYQRHRVYISF